MLNDDENGCLAINIEGKQLEAFKRLLDAELAKDVGEHPRDRMAKGLCVYCGLPALERCYSEAGRKEYGISGSCEKCFDEIANDDDLDENAIHLAQGHTENH